VTANQLWPVPVTISRQLLIAVDDNDSPTASILEQSSVINLYVFLLTNLKDLRGGLERAKSNGTAVRSAGMKTRNSGIQKASKL
jgi:hypothetical protein